MVEKKQKIQKKAQTSVSSEQKTKVSCTDKYCPTHGREAVKLRGRTFEGEVIKKLPGRLKIQFDRFLYDRKYERFDKRRTKINARLSDCMKDEIQLGDWIEIKECRPLSKIIHFYVTRKIRSKNIANKNTEDKQ